MKKNRGFLMQNKVFLGIAFVTGLILSIPLVAMKFTNEVQWDLTDFIVMGALLFGMGSLCILAARKVTKTSHRLLVAIAFLFVLLYIWAELAVGIFTNLGS